MPKERTHWILAHEACQALPPHSRLKELLLSRYPAYLAGAVLPDTLLHLFKGEHAAQALALAHIFHDCSDSSYLPLIAVEEKFHGQLPAETLACLLGVLAHMQADIVFHPFVFSLTGVADIGQHYALETALDVYFQQQGKTSPITRLQEIMSAPVKICAVQTCALLFDPGQTLPESALEQALDLHIRFQAMYDHPGWQLLSGFLGCLPGSRLQQKSRLFYPFGLSGKMETPGKHGWLQPVTGEKQSSDADQLFRISVERIRGLFERIESGGMRLAVLKGQAGENLLTGLSGRQLREMRYFAR